MTHAGSMTVPGTWTVMSWVDETGSAAAIASLNVVAAVAICWLTAVLDMSEVILNQL